MPAENIARSFLENEKFSEDISQLRKECISLVKSRAFGSPEDNKENEQWLEQNLFTADENTLKAFVEGYSRHVDFDKELVKKWLDKMDRLVKAGLFSEKSVPEYDVWFLNQKASDKIKCLEHSDLDDVQRAKTLNEFNDLHKYFTKSASSSDADSLRNIFMEKDLEQRKKVVAELKKKKSLLEDAKLPRCIRDQLKRVCILANLGTCQKVITEGKKRHSELKNRFLNLPPLIQEENKKEFKAGDFTQREILLNYIEEKIQQYTQEYRAKIIQMQKPEVQGLTLFSSDIEEQRGSSAQQYMEWFTQKLTLHGMEAVVTASDLDSLERKAVRDEMAELLEKIPEKKWTSLIEKFNKADLDKRKILLADYQAQIKKDGRLSIDKGMVAWIKNKLHKLLFSGARNDLTRETETWAVANEIAVRRHRARLTYHTTSKRLTEKARENDLTETLDRTKRLKEAVHSERLKNANGDLKLKVDVLKSENESRTSLKKGLKPDVENKNAKLTGVELRTKGGEVSIDESAYRHGELTHELEIVQDRAAILIKAQVPSAGINLSQDQIKQQVAQVDWQALGKETIKRAA